MAAIDKCYVNNWDDYKAFIDWAKGKTYTTPRGVHETVSHYVFQWTEDDFASRDGLPIFSSPTHFDNYLYHNCPLQFIQDWLADRYCGNGYCKGYPDEIKCELKIPDYDPCTKVTVIKKGRWGEKPYRYHRSGYSKKIGSWMVDAIQLDENGEYAGSLWYNDKHDFWILPYENDSWTCSAMFTTISVRSIIRLILKKWKLPKNVRVSISGRIVGDDWILLTK